MIKRLLRRWYRGIPQDERGRLLWGRWFRKLAFRLMLWFFGLSIGSVILYSFMPVPATPLMFIRSAEQIGDAKRELTWKRDWVPLDQISPNLQLAVVCAEDQLFLEHEGFDFQAIEKAYEHNKTHKRKLGASTISQQTAKNVFLWPNRSWLRKGLEVYFTFLIEVVWSKKRIMTVYLNSIEFGDGIYGAEAAAQHFFKKPASKLSVNEAALLASCIRNPFIYSVANPNKEARRKQKVIMRDMKYWDGRINYEEPNTPGVDE